MPEREHLLVLATVLPVVQASRYVTAFREGGSLPGLMEADDLGTYVVKFHGAGQGRKALIAEVIGGELARALGLPVPALVGVELDPAIATNEPDEEIQDLLKASAGLNLGVDFLPGALDLDATAFPVDAALAGRILWFDALIGNVDRSWRNPNLLRWHGRPYLIDHGAALTFHHSWPARGWATRPYSATEHALLGCTPDVAAAETDLAPLITTAMLVDAVDLVPTPWLSDEPGFADEAELRAALRRTAHPASGRPGAVAARPARGGCRVPRRSAGRAGTKPPQRLTVTSRLPFQYTVLRVVPRVERGESMNAGVLLYCRAADFLQARVHLDVARLRALDPHLDQAELSAALQGIADACNGHGDSPAAVEEMGHRFRWLSAPHSTVVQPGPVHTGLTADPSAELDRLLERLVAPL